MEYTAFLGIALGHLGLGFMLNVNGNSRTNYGLFTLYAAYLA